MKNYKVIVFDLDGTIIDSSEGITKSAEYALNFYGIDVDSLDSLRFFIGPPLFHTFSTRYGFDEIKAREAVDKYRERYNKIGIFECSLYPGIKECIEKLKEAGYIITLGSSKPEISCKRILEHHGILDLFDNVCGATMDGKIDTKAEVLTELLKRFKDVSVEDMVLIGDTMFDLNGANEVGMDTIAVSYGFGDEKEMLDKGAVASASDCVELMNMFV